MRPERIGLEHHADVALPRRHLKHVLPADDHAPVLRVVEAGDKAQQRGLAAARRTEKGKELARLDFKVDVFQHMQRAIIEVHVLDADCLCRADGQFGVVDGDCHCCSSQILFRHSQRLLPAFDDVVRQQRAECDHDDRDDAECRTRAAPCG